MNRLNRNPFFSILSGLIGFNLLLMSASGAFAQTTNTWTGQTSSDWHIAANWSLTAVPGTNNDVIIPVGTNYAPVLSTTAVAKSVEVQSGASLTISSAGSLTISNAKSLTISSLPYNIAFFNSGTVVNEGALSAGNTAQVGLWNLSSFSNLTGGSITIDGTSSRALFNYAGTFVNAGTIRIGSITGVGPWAIENQASFSNVSGGNISIDRTDSFGLFNPSGTFSNAATITIGSVTNIGSMGLRNQSSFTNMAGGNITINRSSGIGLSNESPGIFINSATITLGSIANAGSTGLSNLSSFSNVADGSITIDRSGNNALVNSGSGSFVNSATITIGTVPDAGFFGLSNQASFSNLAGGSISIDRTGNTGMSNSSGSFVNAATITIGTVAIVGFAGLSNAASFSNLAGGSITIDRTSNVALSNISSIVNEATITIGASATGNAISNGGTINNQGCQALINSLGNAVISNSTSFSNTGTIIERSSGNSSISYNGGLVQNLNGSTFSIGSGNAAITGTGLFWRGCVSSDWNTPANWSGGTVPIATDDVIIPAGTTYTPVLSTTAVAKSVEVHSGASLTISSSGSLSIHGSKSIIFNSSVYITAFFNGGNVVNQGALSMGNTGGSGVGLWNVSSFNNLTGGSITIDQTSNRGLFNGSGSFVNSATIVIGSLASVGTFGLYNESSFSNVAGGSITIDQTSNRGLFNGSGSFVNSAKLAIGSLASVGDYGLYNKSSFSNTTGAHLSIDQTTNTGLYNDGGSFVNSSTLVIGSVAPVGDVGIYNLSSFSNTAGSILIDQTTNSGIYNASSSNFVNSATLIIGSLASVGIFGLFNGSSFSNLSGGSIQIDRVNDTGLQNQSSFINSSTLLIGSTVTGGNTGLSNTASFSNLAGGIISIERTNTDGILNSNSFVNSATISIGTSATSGQYALHNISQFSNTAGGSLSIDHVANGIYNVGNSFINSATLTLGTSISAKAIDNFATANNQGCQALINSLGNAIISNSASFSNTGTIIEHSSGSSNISYNGGLILNNNGGSFTVASGQPPLSLSATDLTTCNPANGSLTIAGVQPATAYTLSYTLGNTTASLSPTSNGSGQLTTANLSAGTYALALSGSCVAQALPLSATLNAPAAFTLTTQPPATSVVCAGASVSATVSVSGTTGPVTYQWYKNSLASPVASQTTATLSLTNLTAAESGSYSVVITDNCASSISSAFNLMVNDISMFTVSSATVCPGQLVNLTTSGCSGQVYWSTGATTNMITLTAGSSSSLLTVTCTVGVCSTTANGQVVVGGIQPPPAQILSFTADESACPVRLVGRGVGSSFTMTGPMGYVFSTVFRQGGIHEAVGLNVKQAGIYTLTATYTNSCGTSAPVSQKVTVGRSCL